jgi:hypothetical protein
MIYNESLAQNESECIDVLGQVLCEPCARFSAKRMRISPKFIKNRSQKSQEI